MRHLTYHHNGYDEQLLAFGPQDAAIRILIIPPLFDEMNRVRSTLVAMMREAAEDAISCALPDLPGCNESSAKFETQCLSSWRDAMASAAEEFQATHVLSIRGGCLIDDFDPAMPLARLASVKGKSLLNMLIRTRMTGDKEMGLATTAGQLAEQAENRPVELAGNSIGPVMWSELNAAVPDGLSHNIWDVVLKDIGGSALWLRAEPQHDAQMATGMSDMLKSWSEAAI